MLQPVRNIFSSIKSIFVKGGTQTSGSLIKFAFVIFLIYAFSGLLAFFPFFLGLLLNVFTFPLDFLNNNIYPVSNLPYIILEGGIVFVFILFVIGLFSKNH